MPILVETIFVLCEVFNEMNERKKLCKKILERIVLPLRKNVYESLVENARQALASLLQKAYVLDKSYSAEEKACLRRKKIYPNDLLLGKSLTVQVLVQVIFAKTRVLL